jgi:hypothetical protein
MRATKEEWFEWFYYNCDFGPADSDVRYLLKQHFMKVTGKEMPEGWDVEEELGIELPENDEEDEDD